MGSATSKLKPTSSSTEPRSGRGDPMVNAPSADRFHDHSSTNLPVTASQIDSTFFAYKPQHQVTGVSAHAPSQRDSLHQMSEGPSSVPQQIRAPSTPPTSTETVNTAIQSPRFAPDTIRQLGKLANDLGKTAEKYSDEDSRPIGTGYTEDEIRIIREAHTLSQDASAILQLLDKAIKCHNNPRALLHVPGFSSQELEMLVSTCQEENWISASFARLPAPLESSTSGRGFFCSACDREPGHGHGQHVVIQGHLRYTFNEANISERPRIETEHPLCRSHDVCVPTSTPIITLKDWLVPPTSPSNGMQRTSRPSLRDRKLIAVFLALSMMHFIGCGRPQHHLDSGVILIPLLEEPRQKAPGRIRFRPYIDCDIRSQPNPAPDMGDYVAALGVLILELDTYRLADWTDQDIDPKTNNRSNQYRLARILDDQEWKENIEAAYKRIGEACLDFMIHVLNFEENSPLENEIAPLAVLYKEVLSPLYILLVSRFGTTINLLPEVSRITATSLVPTAPGPLAHSIILFDDLDSAESDERVKYARDHLNDMRAISDIIKNMRCLTNSIQVAPIRIAVLDTGVSDNDEYVKRGLLHGGKIKDCRSWVGDDDGCSDTCGHGTHVVRLLLRTAPTAEIYVAKISAGLKVDGNAMGRIAKAIDYAVDNWQVDIISMSFGFHGKNKEIEDALDRAKRKDKLLIAAASNGGGNSSRSRPACQDNVLCIHACDGNGNSGNMNPTPHPDSDNFTTLGIGIRSRWNGKNVFKSGTSFATPIAAGIAANMIEFANSHPILSDYRQLIRTFSGMRAVFRRLSKIPGDPETINRRGGYRYVTLFSLWEKSGAQEGQSKSDKIAQELRNVLDVL